MFVIPLYGQMDTCQHSDGDLGASAFTLTLYYTVLKSLYNNELDFESRSERSCVNSAKILTSIDNIMNMCTWCMHL